ncbi:MAG TPA: hypothetical protein VIL74_00850 [Pyrinomonadaceae bacterium]|jgi:hypothetical protein
MQTTEKPEKITLRYIPARKLMIGGGSVLITGVWLLWTLYSLFVGTRVLSSPLAGNRGDFIPAAIVGALFLLAFFLVARIAVVTVTISPENESVDADFRRIYGSRTDRFYFTQISYFKAYPGAPDFATYRLALVLENYKEIPLHVRAGKDRKETTRLIKRLNKLINPPPAKASFPKKKRTHANRTKSK